MGAYQDFKPTEWDAAGLGIYDERAGWTVAPVGRNRDSNGRENARFRALLRAMEATGPEADDEQDYQEWELGWCRGKLAGEILRTALTGFLERLCEQANHPVEGEDWEPATMREVER